MADIIHTGGISVWSSNEPGLIVTQRNIVLLLLTALLCGCISPHAKMEQYDLRWYAEDRYRYADAMPARDKNEGFTKVEAYWETIEAIRHIEDKETLLTLDGERMTRDAAREHVRKKIKRTEKIADITSCDYWGRMAFWTASIPYCFFKTPFDAVCIFVESPVTNIE